MNNLIKAQIMLSTLNPSFKNTEIVLAEIIQMSATQENLVAWEMEMIITNRLCMSKSLYRKTISQIRKIGAIKKVGSEYSLTIKLK